MQVDLAVRSAGKESTVTWVKYLLVRSKVPGIGWDPSEPTEKNSVTLSRFLGSLPEGDWMRPDSSSWRERLTRLLEGREIFDSRGNAVADIHGETLGLNGKPSAVCSRRREHM